MLYTKRIHGKDGEIFVAVNNFMLARAEKFYADLHTETVSFNNHGNITQVPTGYRIDLCLK